MKRVIALVLTLAMILSCGVTNVFAESGTGDSKGYTVDSGVATIDSGTPTEAGAALVAAAADEGVEKIVLTGDADITKTLKIGKNLKIDGKGHTIDAEKNTEGVLLVDGITKRYHAVLVQGNFDVTIENVTIIKAPKNGFGLMASTDSWDEGNHTPTVALHDVNLNDNNGGGLLVRDGAEVIVTGATELNGNLWGGMEVAKDGTLDASAATLSFTPPEAAEHNYIAYFDGTEEAFVTNAVITMPENYEQKFDSANQKVYFAEKGAATEYTVAFESNGGSAVEAVKTTTGAIALPEAPTKAGYDFAGWYKDEALSSKFDGTGIVGNITVYAKWEQIKYDVTFEPNGGTAVTYQKLALGEKVAKPANPTKADFTFTGWYKEAECKTLWNFEVDTVNGVMSLYAGWKANTPTPPATYTISFESNGGTAVEAIKTTTGAITLPKAPIKTGYDFAGWFTDKALTKAFDGKNVTASAIVYAKWEEKTTPPVTLNKKALEAAIEDAITNTSSVLERADGTTVSKGTKWVTPAEGMAYYEAIEAASSTMEKGTTQKEIDEAVAALAKATTAFNTAKKDGTKPVVAPSVPPVNQGEVDKAEEKIDVVTEMPVTTEPEKAAAKEAVVAVVDDTIAKLALGSKEALPEAKIADLEALLEKATGEAVTVSAPEAIKPEIKGALLSGDGKAVAVVVTNVAAPDLKTIENVLGTPVGIKLDLTVDGKTGRALKAPIFFTFDVSKMGLNTINLEIRHIAGDGKTYKVKFTTAGDNVTFALGSFSEVVFANVEKVTAPPVTPEPPKQSSSGGGSGRTSSASDFSSTVDRAKSAVAGDRVTVNIAKGDVLPATLMDAIAGKDITVVVYYDGKTYTVNGKALKPSGWDIVSYTPESFILALGVSASVTENATFSGGSYTVKAGDSLWGIAQKLLGNGARYPQIKTLNKMTSNFIFPGQKLLLP